MLIKVVVTIAIIGILLAGFLAVASRSSRRAEDQRAEVERETELLKNEMDNPRR